MDLHDVMPPRTGKAKHRDRYMLEILMDGVGCVYSFPPYTQCDGEHLVRMKFRPRKWQGHFGWNMDRQRLICEGIRKPRPFFYRQSMRYRLFG